MEKIDGPTEPKLSVPITLLQSAFALLKTDPEYASDPLHYHHSCIKGSLLTGFWFLLRSAEYLAEDNGAFDPERSLTWQDVAPWLEGKRLPFHRIAEADKISIAIYSGKNNLETYTRSLPRVPGSDVCVVAALAGVYAAYHRKFGTSPSPRKEVFKKNAVQHITRAGVSNYLKLAADAAGIPMGRVASHSLRRGTSSPRISPQQLTRIYAYSLGGATQYVASGLSDQHVARCGRWKSDAYKAYVYGHSEAIQAPLLRAVHLVPRLERN